MADQGKQWVQVLVGVLIFSAIFFIPISEKLGPKISADLSWMEGVSKGIGEYVFGIKDDAVLNFQGASLTPYATIVIFLMIWLIVFVTFGDILETFSTFNLGTSWLIALCLAVIGGMTGVYNGAAGRAITFLAGYGMWAIVLGVLFSFIIFFLVETGVAGASKGLREYIMRRKLTQEAMGVRGTLMKAGAGAKALAEFEKSLEEK
jgi:hypothetical protein